MKTKFLLMMIFITSFASFVYAEPVSYEEFMKTYQPILDRVYNERLPPIKQTEIGILMTDVICFNGETRVLRMSSPSHVACVSADSAIKLEMRGWGTIHDESRWTEGHGYECGFGWTIHYDETKPKSSELIYKLRHAMKDVAEYLVWHPVEVIEDPILKTINLQSVGNYRDSEIQKISDLLEAVSGVKWIGTSHGACI